MKFSFPKWMGVISSVITFVAGLDFMQLAAAIGTKPAGAVIGVAGLITLLSHSIFGTGGKPAEPAVQ